MPASDERQAVAVGILDRLDLHIVSKAELQSRSGSRASDDLNPSASLD